MPSGTRVFEGLETRRAKAASRVKSVPPGVLKGGVVLAGTTALVVMVTKRVVRRRQRAS